MPSNELRILVARSRDKILGWTKSGHRRCDCVTVPPLMNIASVVPPAKLAMLNRAVLQACDARDGVRDGLLNDPRSCDFNPAALLCRGTDADNCLTPPQLDSVRRMYGPAKTNAGDVIFPGKDRGSEMGWTAIAGGTQPANVSLGSFQVAYSNPNWDWKTFDVDRDLEAVDEKVGVIVNAINPDLSAFRARDGKLLLYHGWNDTAISAGNTVDAGLSPFCPYMGETPSFPTIRV